MKVEKRILGSLEKCYSIAPLTYRGEGHILVAAEKSDPCLLFDLKGRFVDTVFKEPGGVMTMVAVPGTDGQFLATQKFYSPNDSKEAKLVVVTAGKEGGWQVKTLVKLPHVHRFDIVNRGGINYLIACTIKSDHKFKEDWSSPGKIYAAELPEDFCAYDELHPLKLYVIMEGLVKNHGYYRVEEDGVAASVISAECGVFKLYPPKERGGEWKSVKLLDTPASDAVLVDLDGDGSRELAVFSPFHGDNLCFYKEVAGSYVKAYEYDRPVEFVHALYGGPVCGRPAIIAGHRQGERKLLMFTCNKETGAYETEILDEGCGPANVYKYTDGGKEILISTNREINEIAMYILDCG